MTVTWTRRALLNGWLLFLEIREDRTDATAHAHWERNIFSYWVAGPCRRGERKQNYTSHKILRVFTSLRWFPCIASCCYSFLSHSASFTGPVAHALPLTEEKNKINLPSFKGIVSWDDVSAVLADQELDPIIERTQALLGDRGLCLLDDIQGVRGAQA